jgi:hypothetical protein
MLNVAMLSVVMLNAVAPLVNQWKQLQSSSKILPQKIFLQLLCWTDDDQGPML